MHDLLPTIFSAVCGENADHIWAPGGGALPCCQRCTGLYVGALAAVVLQLGSARLWRAVRGVPPSTSWKLTLFFPDLRCTKFPAGTPETTRGTRVLPNFYRMTWGQGPLCLHTLCLLQLGLFLFPWMPSTPVLRTISGSLFGFGVVAFLWPAVGSLLPRSTELRFDARIHALGFTVSLGLTLALAEWGGRPGAFILDGLITLGALALAALVVANLGLFIPARVLPEKICKAKA